MLRYGHMVSEYKHRAFVSYSDSWEIGEGGYVPGEPTATVLSADGFPLMTGPNFQPSDGNPTVISILRQLADGPENVPEI